MLFKSTKPVGHTGRLLNTNHDTNFDQEDLDEDDIMLLHIWDMVRTFGDNTEQY